MATNKKLLLLCGETSLDLADFCEIVTFSPIRKISLAGRKTGIHTLSDFAPDEDTGRALDLALYRNIDICLHAEALENTSLRWAPISYLQIQIRLARYCWLKQTLAKLVTTLVPESVVLSSARDDDMVHALRALTLGTGIRFEICNGELDQSTTMHHRIRPYGLPATVDPNWVTELRWRAWRAMFGKREYLVQPYWNLDIHDDTLFLLKGFSAINFLGRALAKFCEIFKIRNQEAYFHRPVELTYDSPKIIQSPSWRERFADDEVLVINHLLIAFAADFPATRLDAIERALLAIFDAVGVHRVVLIHDQLDACRMIAHAAHRRKIFVDYLPHGLMCEDFSGEHRNSPFSPDRVLAWNSTSADAFRQLGWKSSAVSHPQFQKEPLPFRRLGKNWENTRVLVLSPEWSGVTQSEQEDCAVTDMIATYNGLGELGIRPENIYLKLHASTPIAQRLKRQGLLNLRAHAKMKFTLLDTSARTMELITQYDLVVLGLTTGIFEAVMLGVPMVIFGLSPRRVGGLAGFKLPYAATAQALTSTLQEYDNDHVAATYAQIAASLRHGRLVIDTLADSTPSRGSQSRRDHNAN